MTTTHGSTTFTTTGDQVTITRHDQPECTVPIADVKRFANHVALFPEDETLDVALFSKEAATEVFGWDRRKTQGQEA